MALGVGSALLYLHQDCQKCVVHRDIKPSNIMLDASFNAKLGDFGLARLIDHGRGSHTTVLSGTIGYMDPECMVTGNTSIQSDVYSFGVVVLEITCGRPATIADVKGTTIHLVHWVWEFYSRGRILDAADARLNGDFNAAEMERVMVTALWCAHPDRTRRPHPGGYECAPPPGRTVAKSPCERASGSVVVLAVASLPASVRSPAIATLVSYPGV